MLRIAGITLALAFALAPSTSFADPAAPTTQGPQTAAAAKAEAARIQRAVAGMQLEAEQLTESYNANEERLAAVTQSADLHQVAVDDASTLLASARQAFDDEMRRMYIRGPQSPVELLLSARSLGDLTLARRAAQGLTRSHTANVTAVRQAAAAVERQAGDLRVTQAQALALRATLAAQRQSIVTTLAAEQELLTSANETVRRLLAEEEARAEAARRAAVAAALARAKAASLPASAALAAQPTLPVTDLQQLPSVPAPTVAAATAVRAALSQLGKPYQWGATGPGSFDCSGLTQWAYSTAGVTLPRTAAEQSFAGPPVAKADLLPGDLVFFATDASNAATIHHVGMYVGGGLMVAAPHTGAQVRVEGIAGDYYGANRPTAPMVQGSPGPPRR